ncbi:MAG: AraC family transcriptional regulator [Henriciella sp.]
MAQATVSAGYATSLVDLAVSLGANRTALLQRGGLSEDDLTDPETRVSFAVFKTLMRAGKELANAPSLALTFGALVNFEDLSIVGLVAHAAPTMLEAFQQMNRYHRLVIEVEGVAEGEDRFKLVERDDGLWIDDTRKNPNDFPELTESTLGRFICGYNRNFKKRRLVKIAHVTHARPSYGDEYETVLQCPVVFGSDRNSMLVDPAWPKLQLWPKPRYVFGVLTNHAEHLLDELKASRTVRSEVEQHLLPILHTGDVHMQTIATTLNMSRQTLYRKLKSEGVTFEAILDELRHKMARHYLEGEKVSVNETAYLVGFSDPSSFSRAFKRWTGHSPGKLKASPRKH